jgi:hypothetical protein
MRHIGQPVLVQGVDADHRHLPVRQPLLGGHPGRVDGPSPDLELVEVVGAIDDGGRAHVVQVEGQVRRDVAPQPPEGDRLGLGEVLPVPVEVDLVRRGASFLYGADEFDKIRSRSCATHHGCDGVPLPERMLHLGCDAGAVVTSVAEGFVLRVRVGGVKGGADPSAVAEGDKVRLLAGDLPYPDPIV